MFFLGIWASEGKKVIILKDVKVISGGHCESSAINNALNYLGYDLNEALVVGGGGALGFTFQKGDFPFLGGRSLNMREVFFSGADIKWHLEKPEQSDPLWNTIITVLEKGIPVVLRVDMRFLPYLYGGQYGPPYASFGWHMITLFGLDFKTGMAWVSDTALPGLQKVKISDLEKARCSETKIFPPKREYFWVEKKPLNYKTDWNELTINGLKWVITNMEMEKSPAESGMEANLGLEGIKKLGSELVNIEQIIKNKYMLPMVFHFLYGCIETNGTGGAAFRILFRDFLKQAAEKLNNSKIKQVIPHLEASIEAWHELASGFKEISQKIAHIQKKEERLNLYHDLAKRADNLYKKEKTFYQLLKAAVSEKNK
jgi:hypothetical protein